mmetsp:Transcript_31041/g.101208  ORF Transcript_31041/g.101208 Transcript_31041/m.101208 type:complete len:225 (-) Transcript_31041:369-1043(-)
MRSRSLRPFHPAICASSAIPWHICAADAQQMGETLRNGLRRACCTMGCHPPHSTLAGCCSCSPATVQRALASGQHPGGSLRPILDLSVQQPSRQRLPAEIFIQEAREMQVEPVVLSCAHQLHVVVSRASHPQGAGAEALRQREVQLLPVPHGHHVVVQAMDDAHGTAHVGDFVDVDKHVAGEGEAEVERHTVHGHEGALQHHSSRWRLRLGQLLSQMHSDTTAQ